MNGNIVIFIKNTPSMEAFRKIYPQEYYLKFLQQKIRPDGRGLTSVRKTAVSVGSVTTAFGSSFVRIGSTAVTCGVKAEIGRPSEKKVPHLAINIELLPICSSQFQHGAPSTLAQTLCEYLNKLVLDIIPQESFKIAEMVLPDSIAPDPQHAKAPVKELKESYLEGLEWYLFVDLYCLDYNGNILDTAMIAVLAALHNVRLPSVIMREGVMYASEDRKSSLTILYHPIPLTFGIFDNLAITDPTAEEEKLGNGTFSIVFNEKEQLCGIIKPSGNSIDTETLNECMNQASVRAKQVLELIKNAK